MATIRTNLVRPRKVALIILAFETLLLLFFLVNTFTGPWSFSEQVGLAAVFLGLFGLALASGLFSNKMIALGGPAIRFVLLAMLFFYSPGLALTALLLVPTTVALFVAALLEWDRRRT